MSLVVILLIVWSALDPPFPDNEMKLTEDETDEGETIVIVNSFCGHTSNAWRYALMIWLFILLLWAIVLAFQSRDVRQSFNESQVLGVMIYSHAVFAAMIAVTFWLEEGAYLASGFLSGVRSIIYSIDTCITCCIYFIPKCFASEETLNREPPKPLEWAKKNMLSVRKISLTNMPVFGTSYRKPRQESSKSNGFKAAAPSLPDGASSELLSDTEISSERPTFATIKPNQISLPILEEDEEDESDQPISSGHFSSAPSDEEKELTIHSEKQVHIVTCQRCGHHQFDYGSDDVSETRKLMNGVDDDELTC